MGKASRTFKTIKRTLKFISISPDPKIVRAMILKAPDAVIRAMSNAALNAHQGEVADPLHLKKLFRKHNRIFDTLIDRRRSLAEKRRVLVQRGGALPIIAPLIATVLGSIGGEFISKIFRNND